MRFDLEYNEVVVVEAAQAAQATADVLISHSIPFAMSSDLRQELPK